MFRSDFLRFLGFKGKPKAVRKPDGYTKTTGPYGELIDCDTLQCSHCRHTWEVVAGSGRLRGTCNRCLGYICGSPSCMSGCVTFEERLANHEAGRPELTPAVIQASVPGSVLTPPKILLP